MQKELVLKEEKSQIRKDALFAQSRADEEYAKQLQADMEKIQKLEQAAEENINLDNFIIHHVVGDGNCMYRSIARSEFILNIIELSPPGSVERTLEEKKHYGIS